MSVRRIHGVIMPNILFTLCGRKIENCIVTYDPFDPIINCSQCRKQLEWA